MIKKYLIILFLAALIPASILIFGVKPKEKLNGKMD